MLVGQVQEFLPSQHPENMVFAQNALSFFSGNSLQIWHFVQPYIPLLCFS